MSCGPGTLLCRRLNLAATRNRSAPELPTLSTVLDGTKDALEAWTEMPRRVEVAYQEIRQRSEDLQQTEGCRQVARRVTAALEEYRLSPLPWVKLRRLPALVDTEYQWTQKTPGCENIAEIL